MIDQETRKAALRTFKEIIDDPGAKAADRIRAAEGILKLDSDEKDKGLSNVLDASDEELLEMARGKAAKTEIDPFDDGNPAQ